MTTYRAAIVGLTEFLRVHLKGNQCCEHTITDASPAYHQCCYEIMRAAYGK
jgi:hypothetical protein